jgi:type III restriction enzyme
VAEILEMEDCIFNSPLLTGDRSKYHFSVYNIKYDAKTKETENKDTETFNYKEYVNFASETFVYDTEAKYMDTDGKDSKISYTIEKCKYHISEVINKIFDEFQKRRLEGKILKLGKDEYANENLPSKEAIEGYIRNSMSLVGMEGNYLGEKNRQMIFTTFGTLLRKKPKSLRITREFDELIEIKTQNREQESVSVLGIHSGSSVFFTDNYNSEIVEEDSLNAFKELKDDDSLPKWSFKETENINFLKTPIDLVFSTKEPERKFIQELIKKENAMIIDRWIKSTNKGFY